MPPTLISAVEVPAEADERFVGEWERAPRGLLYRALRSDVALRFVSVGWESDATLRADRGLYELVRERGRPDVDEAAVLTGAVVIETFEAATGQDDAFLAGWDGAAAVLAQQRGYRGARLHRSIEPARFRFVSLARWSSPLMVARALQAAAALPEPSHRALYQVIRAGPTAPSGR